MRKFAFGLLVSAAVGMTAVTVSAQTAATCPTLKLNGPKNDVSEGKKELLFVSVQNAPASVKPEYKWTTNGGKGEMGSTPGIAWLDTTGVPVGTNILVTVEAVGYGCTVKTEATIKMVERGPCPQVSVYSPDTADPATPLTMNAIVQMGDTKINPSYNWAVSAGKISSGQGTSVITLDLAGASGFVTATVNVGGYPPECMTTASSTTSIASKPVTRKFDEFTPMMKDPEINNRLDNFAIELMNDPAAKGVLLFYAGRTSRIGAIDALLDYAKNHLSTKRKISLDRVVLRDGGFKEAGMVELWIMPAGSDLPTPSNFLDPSEVKQLPALKKKPGTL